MQLKKFNQDQKIYQNKHLQWIQMQKLTLIEKLKIIVRSLLAEEQLDPIHRDHRLIGKWKGRRECHIESDWLLIYKKTEELMIFERMGSHSDLFRK